MIWSHMRPRPAWLYAAARSAEGERKTAGQPWRATLGLSDADAADFGAGYQSDDRQGWGQAWRVLRSAITLRLVHDSSQTLAQWPLLALTGLPAGILLYFALPVEPPLWLGGLGLLICLALSLWFRRRAAQARGQGSGLLLSTATLGLGFATACCLGIAAASFRTASMSTPRLERPIFAKQVTGVVRRSEQEAKAWRLWVEPETIEGWREGWVQPRLLRLRLAEETVDPALLQVGARLKGRVQAFPPSEPVRPGGLDIQRLAYFQGIGGYGRFMDLPELVDAAPQWTLSSALELWREQLAQRLRQRFPGDVGQAMTALVVGHSQGLSEQGKEAIRKSGLAHLFAISGLHMGIVAGFAFLCLRFALLGLGGPVLRLHAKKLAALATLGTAAGYLLISGAAIPAQRAFLMLALVLTAVAFDRRAFSPRLVGWAAAVILLTRPDSLLTPSFQMSFAAVSALIAFAPIWQRLLNRGFFSGDGQERSVGLLLASKASGLMVTSVLATLATAPFVLATFHRLALAGLVSNLLAVPLTGLWILPWGMVGLLLSPFGLGDLAFVPMSWGVGILLEWAHWFANLDVGLIYMASFSGGWTALTGMALWLALLSRGVLRIGAGLLLLASFWGPMAGEPARAFVAGNARSVAIQSPQGLILYRTRAGSFVADQWSHAQGWQDVLSLKQAEAQGLIRCDELACVTTGVRPIAISQDYESLIEDCQSAALVISLQASLQGCSVPLIDYARLKQRGAVAIYAEGAGWDIHEVRAWQGKRPWTKWWPRQTRKPKAAVSIEEAPTTKPATGGTGAGSNSVPSSE